jgi:hypothetical protein
LWQGPNPQANSFSILNAATDGTPMFFLIVLIAWVGGVLISFYNGNRKLPLIVLLLGLGLLFAPIGIWKLAGLALLAAIIWVANKMDM